MRSDGGRWSLIRHASRSGDSPSAQVRLHHPRDADQQAVDTACQRRRRVRGDRQAPRPGRRTSRGSAGTARSAPGRAGAPSSPVPRPGPGRRMRHDRRGRTPGCTRRCSSAARRPASARAAARRHRPAASTSPAPRRTGISFALGARFCPRVLSARCRARNASVVSKSGSNSSPSRSSVLPISADAIREVSSPMLRQTERSAVAAAGSRNPCAAASDPVLRRRRPCSGPCPPARGSR